MSISLNNLNNFHQGLDDETLDNNAFMMYCAYSGVIQHFMGYTNVFKHDPFSRFKKENFMLMEEKSVKRRMMYRYIAQRFIESQGTVSQLDMITAFAILHMEHGSFALQPSIAHTLISTFNRYKTTISNSNKIIQKDVMYLIKEARAKGVSFEALLRYTSDNSFPYIYWEFMGRRLSIMTLYAISSMFSTLVSNPGKLTLFEYYEKTYADNDILLEHIRRKSRWEGVYKFDWEYLATLFLAAKRMTEK